MAESIPVFDLTGALNRTMGDATFLRRMIGELQRAIPGYLARIQTAFEANDMPAMGHEAHQFKGAAANLGASAVAAVALQVERIGLSGSPEGAPEALEQLELAVDEFNRYVSNTDWSAAGDP